jgi:hypothetical protein
MLMKKLLLLLLVQVAIVFGQQEIFEACDPPVEPLQIGTVAEETISRRMKENF